MKRITTKLATLLLLTGFGLGAAAATSDALLTHRIRQELMFASLSSEGRNVVITASEGAITLSGVARNEHEKRLILQAAQKYSQDVRSEIAVRP